MILETVIIKVDILASFELIPSFLHVLSEVLQDLGTLGLSQVRIAHRC